MPYDSENEIETTRTLYKHKNVYDVNTGKIIDSRLMLPESYICNYGTVRGKSSKENRVKIDLSLPESAFPKQPN